MKNLIQHNNRLHQKEDFVLDCQETAHIFLDASWQTSHPVPVQYYFCHQKLHIRTHLAMVKADKKSINLTDTVNDA